jgi:rubrerythrin
MVDNVHAPGAAEEADFVQVFATGEPAKGEYHCSECGYGVAVFSELPVCPMCGGKSWEQSSWSPFRQYH